MNYIKVPFVGLSTYIVLHYVHCVTLRTLRYTTDIALYYLLTVFLRYN